MAVASGPPMKMGSTRREPERSRSKAIGVFDGSSTRTPTRSISTTRAPYRRARTPTRRSERCELVELVAEGSPQKGGAQALAQPGQLGHGGLSQVAGLGVALVGPGSDELGEQVSLALCR